MLLKKVHNLRLINKIILSLLAIISLLGIFIFYKTTKTYFLQDDWFLLNNVKSLNLQVILEQFKSRNDVIYYRPIGMQLFFLFAKNLFKLNYQYYHLLIFIIYFINIYLIKRVVYAITQKSGISIIFAFMYCTSSFNIISLSWLALSWNIFGLLFLLVALILFISYTKNTNKTYYFASIVFYLLSIGSSEFSLNLLLLMIIYLNINYSGIVRSKVKILIPFILISISYIIFRIINLPTLNNDYGVHLGLNIIKNLFWYFVWLFNIPEEIKYQTVITKLSLTPNIISNAGIFFYPLLFACLGAFFSLIVLIKTLNIKSIYYLFGIILFGLSLLPVLSFTSHSFTYYLTVPSLVILLYFSLLFKKISLNKVNKNYLVILIILWLLSSFFNIKITKRLHWIYKEELVSHEFVINTLSKYKEIPKNTSVVLLYTNGISKQSLQDQQALQVIYNDKSLRTIYQENSKDYVWTYSTSFVVKIN